MKNIKLVRIHRRHPTLEQYRLSRTRHMKSVLVENDEMRLVLDPNEEGGIRGGQRQLEHPQIGENHRVAQFQVGNGDDGFRNGHGPRRLGEIEIAPAHSIVASQVESEETVGSEIIVRVPSVAKLVLTEFIQRDVGQG